MPEDKIDVGRAALTFAKEIYPAIDIETYSRKIDAMATEARRFVQRYAPRDDPESIIRALNTYYYKVWRVRYDNYRLNVSQKAIRSGAYGVGGGVMYSPTGGLPAGQGALAECGDDQAFLELFGKAGISGLGMNLDVIAANTGKGLTTGRPYSGLSWLDPSFGKKWGLKAEAAGGVQMTAVTRPRSTADCTCRAMAHQ